MIDDLLAAGVNPAAVSAPTVRGGALPLLGQTFVLTGTLPKRSRGDAEDLIKRHGGKVTGSVSKNTTYVLCGSDPGSKRDKAVQLNIPVIDEVELERMLGL